jgi:hypothetical protein
MVVTSKSSSGMREIVLPKGLNFLEQFWNIGLLLILATEPPSSIYVSEYDIVCLPEHFPISHKPLRGRGVTVRYIANTLLLGYQSLSERALPAPRVQFNLPPSGEETGEVPEEEPNARRGDRSVSRCLRAFRRVSLILRFSMSERYSSLGRPLQVSSSVAGLTASGSGTSLCRQLFCSQHLGST